VKRRLLRVLNGTLNRVTSRMARSAHGPFSLVRHVGRRSGQTYETPVILATVPEGFVAELTFGDEVNWYRNVTAAGGCVVVHRGREFRVVAIEGCDAEYGRGAFPHPFRDILKILDRRDFRLLRVADQG
jgi:deazaflavin-dependent oxidoreductase (nitroreductase family)